VGRSNNPHCIAPSPINKDMAVRWQYRIINNIHTFTLKFFQLNLKTDCAVLRKELAGLLQAPNRSP